MLGADLAWNAIVHDSPPGGPDFHWHIELLPRLTVPASVELGAGVVGEHRRSSRGGERGCGES